MVVKSCEKAEKSQVILTVEVDAEEFDAAMETAYRGMRRKIRIPGFRPGKAPRKIVEGMYGPELFYEDAVNAALPDAYEAAVKEQELKVVGQPTVELQGTPNREGFIFTATVPVYPEVKLGKYKGLSAPKMEVTVTEADVDARINQLADRNTRLVSTDREAREGDSVVIDYEGFMDGVPFDGGKENNRTLELGSHLFVPGFEEQLIGVKAGDEREIKVTFPEQYVPSLAGKEAVFRIQVHEVKEKDVPEIDDEFAKDVSEFDTLAELRESLRTAITQEREQLAQHNFEDELMGQVAAGITAEIPDVLVQNQAKRFVEDVKSQVAYQQGMTYEQYAKLTGSDEEKLLQSAMEPALRQVQMDLAVAAIIEEEHLEATDEDIDKEFAAVAEQAGIDVESIRKYFTVAQMRDQALTKKAIALVTDSAVAESVPAAEAKNAESGAERTEAPAENGGSESAETPAENSGAEDGENG